jgi:hypothetical protein
MKVFNHHIYEYRKGLRNLILHTVSGKHQRQIEIRLKKLNIAYEIYALGNGNINVFFGAEECVDVIKAIAKPSLTDYTPQEDFILGTMLGYDCLQQCRRYMKLISRKSKLSKNESQSSGGFFDVEECNDKINFIRILKTDREFSAGYLSTSVGQKYG